MAPTSTAVFDSVMDTKKSASATRKISRKGMYEVTFKDINILSINFDVRLISV